MWKVSAWEHSAEEIGKDPWFGRISDWLTFQKKSQMSPIWGQSQSSLSFKKLPRFLFHFKKLEATMRTIRLNADSWVCKRSDSGKWMSSSSFKTKVRIAAVIERELVSIDWGWLPSVGPKSLKSSSAFPDQACDESAHLKWYPQKKF